LYFEGRKTGWKEGRKEGRKESVFNGILTIVCARKHNVNI